MFHKIKSVTPLQDYRLSVQFLEGETKTYDVKPLFERYPMFKFFIEHPEEFFDVSVDTGGYGVIWNDDIDLSCNELWENGVDVCK